MLEAAGVGYAYRPGAEAAVAGADLRAEAGEVVALLGPNGAGKSTFLRLLDGRLEPTRGRIRRPPARSRDGVLTHGWAGEETPHFETLSGRANARFFARAAGLGRGAAARAVEALLGRLALVPEADRPVADYSFGARRKLALVEAMAHRPSLLLLDEPTVGLDATAREVLARLLGERAEQGAAVVLASHDTAFVEEVADRVVFMVEGGTRGGGRPRELVASLGREVWVDVTLAPGAPGPPAGLGGRGGPWSTPETP